jgi:hypothetical protein
MERIVKPAFGFQLFPAEAFSLFTQNGETGAEPKLGWEEFVKRLVSTLPRAWIVYYT